MKARRMVDGASYPPEVVEAMGQAFDSAWAQIAGNFGDDPARMEEARLRWADAMLSVAAENTTNVFTLKWGALEAMAMNYKTANG